MLENDVRFGLRIVSLPFRESKAALTASGPRSITSRASSAFH